MANHTSFSSLFNLQSKSINVKFGHFSPKYQGYSLTFWPKMPHFHHFSICNQNQSISNLVIFHQNTKAIALLFGQKCLIFITFQSAIKINQFQIWSFFTKIPRFIALLFGQTCLIFITFQSAIKINQFQIWSFFTKIPRLYPYFLAKNPSFSSLFNQQSKSINVKFGHFSQNYQGYTLTFWPNMPHFHHLSIRNQNQSMSNLVIFNQTSKAIALLIGQTCLIFITFQSAININQFQIWSFLTKIPRFIALLFGQTCLIFITFNLQSKSINFKFGHFSPKYQGYSLTFRPKMPHFHHLSICNQNQSISNLVIFHQTSKAISLLFGQKCLIFITFQSAIKLNQFQIWSFFTKIPRL